MRDKFRPNLRLTTNILLVIGTFLIAFKVGSLNHYTRTYQQRKDDCAETYALDLNYVDEDFLKKYKLENYSRNNDIEEVIMNFCRFYIK